MKYNVETIVVNENGRHTSYDIRSAFEVAKKSNGVVYYRCKDLKVEHKLVFSNNSLIEFRLKHHHKIVQNIEEYGSQNLQDFMDYLYDVLFSHY